VQLRFSIQGARREIYVCSLIMALDVIPREILPTLALILIEDLTLQPMRYDGEENSSHFLCQGLKPSHFTNYAL
jgi:hypothetical protein